MATTRKIPRCVGIVMEGTFPKKSLIGPFVNQLPENAIIITTSGDAHGLFERILRDRDDVIMKILERDPWVKGKKAQTAVDWILLSHLEAYKGKLFIFPTPTKLIRTSQHNDRMQDILITAHQRQIPYEVITGED